MNQTKPFQIACVLTQLNYHFHSFLGFVCVYICIVQWTLETVNDGAHLWFQKRRRRKKRRSKKTHTHTHRIFICNRKVCCECAIRAYGHGAPQWWNKSIIQPRDFCLSAKIQKKKKKYTQQTISKTNTLILNFCCFENGTHVKHFNCYKALTCTCTMYVERELSEPASVHEYMGSVVWSFDLWGVLCVCLCVFWE